MVFLGCITLRDWFVAFKSAAIRVSTKEMVCFISYFINSWVKVVREATMKVEIFAHSTYCLHSLNYSNSFAVKENGDSINVTKATEYNLVVTRETFVAYIQAGDQAHSNSVILLLLFTKCSRQFDATRLADFDLHHLFFICLFIPIYFFKVIMLLHVL